MKHATLRGTIGPTTPGSAGGIVSWGSSSTGNNADQVFGTQWERKTWLRKLKSDSIMTMKDPMAWWIILFYNGNLAEAWFSCSLAAFGISLHWMMGILGFLQRAHLKNTQLEHPEPNISNRFPLRILNDLNFTHLMKFLNQWRNTTQLNKVDYFPKTAFAKMFYDSYAALTYQWLHLNKDTLSV